jgi:hypothetical protein
MVDVAAQHVLLVIERVEAVALGQPVLECSRGGSDVGPVGR